MTKPINELSDIELCEAVAVEVMGLDRVDNYGSSYALWYGDSRRPVPHYTNDIEAAFEVVAKMREIEFREFELGTHGRDWGATFRGFIGERWRVFSGYGDYAPRAICIAALTAIRARKA